MADERQEIAKILDNEEVEKVRAEVAPVLAAAKALTVTDRSSYEHAMELGSECLSRIKRVEAIFGPSREATYKAWKTVTETVASFTKPLEEAKALLGTKAKAWAREEEARVRREEEARLAEAKRRVEETAEAQGFSAEAASVLGTPIQVAVVSRPVETREIVGTDAGTVRSNWTMRVTDLLALVKAVAAGEVDLEVLQANDGVLRKRAKALKSAMKYPGVVVWDEGAAVFKAR